MGRVEIGLPLDGVDRDRGGKAGRRARAGRDILPKSTSTVPLHPVWRYCNIFLLFGEIYGLTNTENDDTNPQWKCLGKFNPKFRNMANIDLLLINKRQI